MARRRRRLWFRSYGNEQCEFDELGPMCSHAASIDELLVGKPTAIFTSRALWPFDESL
jgi:nuclear transport factor 2 (NTF2) superfamily protein